MEGPFPLFVVRESGYAKGSGFGYEGFCVDSVFLEFLMEILPRDSGYLGDVRDVSIRLLEDFPDISLFKDFSGLL